MKIATLFCSFILFTTTTFGQLFCFSGPAWDGINFDSNSVNQNWTYMIDTLANPNNVWQVGPPQKTIINSAYSSPNVIITDTLNYYPNSDTSSFFIIELDQGGFTFQHTADLYGSYYVNSDSLNDYGTIEISLDKGSTWINLITDTIYSSYYWWNSIKPVLTGNSHGWQNFWVSVQGLSNVFPVNWGDTILWKFTFICDSNSDTLDGLAFDGFEFCNLVESVREIQNNNIISLYPNPAADWMIIQHKYQFLKTSSVQIINFKGQVEYFNQQYSGETIDISKLTNGIYLLRYTDDKSSEIKKLIVQH